MISGIAMEGKGSNFLFALKKWEFRALSVGEVVNDLRTFIFRGNGLLFKTFKGRFI